MTDLDGGSQPKYKIAGAKLALTDKQSETDLLEADPFYIQLLNESLIATCQGSALSSTCASSGSCLCC